MNKRRIFLILGLIIIGSVIYFNKSDNQPKPIKPEVEATSVENKPTISPKDEKIGWQKTTQKFYAPILLYHHIELKRPQNSYYVSPDIFDEQMKWLKDNDYTVISLDDFYTTINNEELLPPKPVVITFDDGYRDQYENAFPILKKYDFTATFYLKINNFNKGGMHADEVKELLDAGNVIGSHSINHDNLTKMSPDDLKYDLTESKKILEKELGVDIKHYCYPGGAYDDNVISALLDTGYKTSTTTKHKVYHEIKNKDSYFTLPRVHIDDEMPTFIDWVQGINLY